MNKCLISFFLLLSVFWLCCPLTNAYTFDEFIDFCNENYSSASSRCQTQINFINSNKTTLLSTLSNNNVNVNDYEGFILAGQNGYRLYLLMFKFRNTSEYYFNQNTIYHRNIEFREITKYGSSGPITISASMGTNEYNGWSSLSGNDGLIGLMLNEPLNNQWGNFIGQQYYVSGLTFEPFPEPTKTLNGVTYYIKSISRTVPMWRLGTLSNISQNGTGKCSAFLDEWVGYWHPFYQPPVNNNGNTSAEVYLDNSKVLYNNAYRIRFSDYDNWTDYTYFIFIPYGETFSGDLISGDLLYTGNDNNDNIGLINTIENQYSLNSGEVGLVLDQFLPSGNFLSGDFGMFTEALGHDYSNSYFDKLYTFYRNILYTLTLTGDVTLNISYRNWSTTLHASDYQVPNNPIKTLVTTLLIVWTIFLFYQQFDKMFRHIATFNLAAFLHDSDVDYHMFL